MKILLIDDQLNVIQSLKDALKPAGHDCVSYQDPKLALECFKQDSFDVIITDYKMPQVNGIELMEDVKDDTKKIMISGYISEIAEEKLQSMDAVFFEKPVPIKELGQIISTEERKINNSNSNN